MDIAPNPTLYVNNLNEKVKVEPLKKALYAIFTQYGDVMDIVAHKSHKTRGQAFIIFKDISCAANALRELQSFPFYDKPIKIQYAKTKSDITAKDDGTFVPRDKKKQSESSASKVGKADKKPKKSKGVGVEGKLFDKNEDPNHILFVQNLPPETTATTLQMLHVQFPGFIEVRVVPGRPDLAFVEFDNEMHAGAAREALQGFMICPTHSIVISYAKK